MAVAGFNEQFDKHGAWRREMGLRLKVLGDWAGGASASAGALEAAACGAAGVCASVAVAARASASPQATR